MLRLSANRVRNSSLNSQAQALLERLALAPIEKPGCDQPEDLPGRSALSRYLDSRYRGSGPQPSRTKAKSFMASRALRKIWVLPGLTSETHCSNWS
jgi:hypothetical protein